MRDDEHARWVRLRAGVRVARRDDRHLQVGSDPRARVVVASTDGVAALLHRLARGLDPTLLPPEEAAVVARLAAARLLVRPAERDQRLLRRSGTLVEVAGPAGWAEELAGRLTGAGVRVVDRPTEDADLVVVLSAGEADRRVAERCLRTDEPALYVAAIDASVRLGPFVVPGRTACLHCLDAHARDRDPRHPVLLEQWAGGVQVAEVESSVVSLALAWACADVVRWCHAARPDTWSATVWLGDETAPEVTPWARHPWCGCSWGGLGVTG